MNTNPGREPVNLFDLWNATARADADRAALAGLVAAAFSFFFVLCVASRTSLSSSPKPASSSSSSDSSAGPAPSWAHEGNRTAHRHLWPTCSCTLGPPHARGPRNPHATGVFRRTETRGAHASSFAALARWTPAHAAALFVHAHLTSPWRTRSWATASHRRAAVRRVSAFGDLTASTRCLCASRLVLLRWTFGVA